MVSPRLGVCEGGFYEAHYPNYGDSALIDASLVSNEHCVFGCGIGH